MAHVRFPADLKNLRATRRGLKISESAQCPSRERREKLRAAIGVSNDRSIIDLRSLTGRRNSLNAIDAGNWVSIDDRRFHVDRICLAVPEKLRPSSFSDVYASRGGMSRPTSNHPPRLRTDRVLAAEPYRRRDGVPPECLLMNFFHAAPSSRRPTCWRVFMAISWNKSIETRQK